MTAIHPTAHVHPSALITGDVQIGARSVIGPYCVLEGPIVIGEAVVIHAFTVIGAAAEHSRAESQGSVLIGDHSVLHPYCLVSRGTGARDTSVGKHCLLLDHVHVAHDSVLCDHVTAAQNVVFAGHVRVHEHANIGIAAVFHQRGTVGAHAMVGMGSVVTKDIPPFVVVSGCPARFMRVHTRGLENAGVSPDAAVVELDALVSEHPVVRAAMRAFEADVRDERRVMSLARRSRARDG